MHSTKDDMVSELKVTTPEIFMRDITSLMSSHKLTGIDAICHWCEKNNVEIESIPSLLKGNSKLKSILQEEGEMLNMLPKVSRLPV